MTDKQEIPASVHYEMTGELKPIEYSWTHILSVCQEALTGDKLYVILPVLELQSTKQNKVRLVKTDKQSPRGLVLKTDELTLRKYYPYAAARFDAEELARYAAKKFNEMEPADIDRLLDSINDGDSGIHAGVE